LKPVAERWRAWRDPQARQARKRQRRREWDEAVLRALDRTGVLPRDTDGRVPPNMVIAFRPRE